MKKIVVMFVALTLLFATAISVNADTAIDIKVNVEPQQYNRLFDVFITFDSDSIRAGKISVSYDDNYVEFRKASSKAFEVEHDVNHEIVTVAFADDNSTVCDKTIQLTFKAIKQGECGMNVSGAVCDDSDYSEMSIEQKCITLVIDKNTISSSIDNTKNSNDTSKQDCGDGALSKQLYVEDSDTSMVWIFYAICGVCVLGVLGYVFLKRAK